VSARKSTQKSNDISNFISASFVAASLVCAHPLPTLAGESDGNIYVQLAKKVIPSVVNISTLTTIKSQGYGAGQGDPFRKFFEDFFRYHGGMPGAPDGRGEEGPGDQQGPQGPQGPMFPGGKAPKQSR